MATARRASGLRAMPEFFAAAAVTMPNTLVGAKPPVLMPEFRATAITIGCTPERLAAGIASGIMT